MIFVTIAGVIVSITGFDVIDYSASVSEIVIELSLSLFSGLIPLLITIFCFIILW